MQIVVETPNLTCQSQEKYLKRKLQKISKTIAEWLILERERIAKLNLKMFRNRLNLYLQRYLLLQ